jgi:hypothetical protein
MSDTLGLGKIRLINEIIKKQWGVNPEQKTFSHNELLYILQEMQRDDGREYFSERVGLRGYHVFREFVKMLLYRNLANYDSMLLLSSEKGSGKSSAALVVAREWNRLLGRPFDPAKCFAYNNADLQNKIDTAENFDVIVADESVRFASSSDWARRENKDLKKKLAQIRTKHLLFILCFPLKVQKIDKVYLDSFVSYWCLTGDTKILIKDINGINDVSIKDLLAHEYEVATYNIEKQQIEYKKPTKCVLTKKDAEVYEVELIDGKKIKATAEHLFLTKKGYKKLIDLTEDDEIVCYY